LRTIDPGHRYMLTSLDGGAEQELALPAPWDVAVNQEPDAVDGVHRLIADARIVRKVKHVE